MYREIKNDVFGRENVKKVLGLRNTAASALIKKMLEKGLITPVKGKGKGRYTFAEQ